jgi:ectoine hydroxylase-related dioxygenase (phytanoyl-CoA dioxygenase family)
LIKTQLILDYVEDLVGPNIVCWGTHYFCKMPGDTKTVPWHQDAAYWPFDKSRTVTAWLAINDADVENGCMHVIPGTHTDGQLKWNEVEGQVLDRQIENVQQYGEAVPFELKAGEISLHADMLAHGSGPNLSSGPRGGLTMRYCPVSVRGDWNTASVICRGSDSSGHWADIPMPEGEDSSPKDYQVQVNAG